MDRRDRSARRAAIGVEPMEGRVVPSMASPMLAPLQGALVRGVSYLDLQGSAHGSATRVVGNPDVGTAVVVLGSGSLASLGTMRVSGTFHGTGFIAAGHLDATLRLSNGRGSVTLQLKGPAAAGFTAPASGTYSFAIQKGTGAFAHDFGAGTVDVALGARSFGLAFHGAPNRF